jgi:hypothetical protein
VSSLPRRQAGGYYITAVKLEVQASPRLTNRIAREVLIPPHPVKPMGESDIHSYMRNLVRYARAAFHILNDAESPTIRLTHSRPQHERVQLLLMSGDRVVGRIDGAQRMFNLRGKMTSPGVLQEISPPNTSDLN